MIGHEATHGLIYRHQSGALHESIADALDVAFRGWNEGGAHVAEQHFHVGDRYREDLVDGAGKLRNELTGTFLLRYIPLMEYLINCRIQGRSHTKTCDLVNVSIAP